MVAYGRTRQISWFESGRKIESARHQDGRRVRHFLSGRRRWYRFRFGTTRLKGDYSDRLPVVRRSLYGTIRGLASLQRRACCGHHQHHTDAHYDGQVLTRITLALENGGLGGAAFRVKYGSPVKVFSFAAWRLGKTWKWTFRFYRKTDLSKIRPEGFSGGKLLPLTYSARENLMLP